MTTKADVVNNLSLELGITKREAKQYLTAFANQVQFALVNHGEALVPGIGKVKVKGRAARVGRNPRTGETLTISARNIARLVPTKSLKIMINQT